MDKITRYSYYLIFILSIGIITSCVEKKSEEKKEHGTATTALIEIIQSNPEVKSMLITSLEKASQLNPDRKTNPVQNLDE